MTRQLLAAACLSFVLCSVARGEEEFIFRVRKAPATHRTAKVQVPAQEEAATPQEPYRAQKGDTLWDVAARFWNSPRAWPELWSLNPQFRNPHRIEPGDPIFLSRGGKGDEVHLPVDHLASGAADAVQSPTPAPAVEAAPEQARPVALRSGKARAGHFVSSHRIPPLGTVAEQVTPRALYVTGDEVALSLSSDAQLKPGDVVTVFDDSRPVAHPVNGTPQGYLVRTLANVKVRSVSGRSAIGKIVEAYDAVPEGAGLMAYRKLPARITPLAAKPDVEGVILSGMPDRLMMSMEDVVFLDRGSIHGLGAGAILEVPVPPTRDYPPSLLDLERPIAKILVVSVEDKTATGLILASRLSVLAGQRFVAAMVSP